MQLPLPAPRPTKPNYQLYLISICFLCAFFLTLVGVLPQRLMPQMTAYFWHYVVAFAIMVALAAVGGTWLKAVSDQSVWTHPPFLITVWTICYGWVLGFYAFYDTVRITWLIRLFQNEARALIGGVYIFPFGLAVMWLVYMLMLNAIKNTPQWLANLGKREVSMTAIWMIYAVALGSQLLQLASTGIAIANDRSQLGMFASLWQWLTYLSALNFLAMVLFIEKAFKEKRSRLPLYIVISIQLGFGFLSGFMKPLIWIAIVVFLSIISNGGKIRQYAIAAVFLGVLAVGSVPIAEGIRLQIGQFNARNVFEVSQAAANAYENSWGSSTNDGLTQVQYKLFGRQIGIAHIPTVIYVATPERFEYQGFQKFLAFPFYVIPRAIWSGKPVLVSGVWFNINYLNAHHSTTSSAAATYFGEGYMISSWLGVATVAIMLAILLAILQRWVFLARLNAFYFAMIPAFLDIEGQAAAMFTGIIQLSIFMIIIYAVVTRLFPPAVTKLHRRAQI